MCLPELSTLSLNRMLIHSRFHFSVAFRRTGLEYYPFQRVGVVVECCLIFPGHSPVLSSIPSICLAAYLGQGGTGVQYLSGGLEKPCVPSPFCSFWSFVEGLCIGCRPSNLLVASLHLSICSFHGCSNACSILGHVLQVPVLHPTDYTMFLPA